MLSLAIKILCSSKVSSEAMIQQESYHKWDERLSNALGSLIIFIKRMTNRHKAAVEWKQHIMESEKRYRDHYAATFEVVKSARVQVTPDPETPSTQVNTAEEEGFNEKK